VLECLGGKEMEWISVKKELPKESRDYIVTVATYVEESKTVKTKVYCSTYYDVEMAKWHINDVDYGWDDFGTDCDVIAWMPYPEPYE